MDIDIPCPEDHLGLLIYVKLCHSTNMASPNAFNQVSFNRVYERLRRVGSVVVSDNPPRSVVPNFVVSVADCKTNWGEFQQHRKIIGLICVGFLDGCSQSNGCCESNGNEENNSEKCYAANGNDSSQAGFAAIFQQYQLLKDFYRSTLVDARCLVVGACAEDDRQNRPSSSAMLDGVIRYASLDDAHELEHDIRDYVKALYWVLEGKRVDLSFEKQDVPPFLVAPDEEKYLVGLDRTTRTFRKRCIGRLRKQVADVTLMTGLPSLAVESYNAAIEQLKSANDWLWLAGSYEGYACAALIAKYGRPAFDSLSPSSSSTTLQRAPTFTPGEMKQAQLSRQHSPHGQPSLPRRAPASTTRLETKHNAIKMLITDGDIEEKFRLAIENYQKFTYAANIECECAFKATAVYMLDRKYSTLDEFINMYCTRFLDGNFKAFTDVQKSQICDLISAVYKTIGFHRKMAFFTRLSALFRLHLNRDDPLTISDYRQIYPLLLSSLDGYRIPWIGSGGPMSTFGGWPALQVRALHETYIAALRAHQREAAVRHLAHMIQVALDIGGSGGSDDVLGQFCNELAQLTSQNGTHNISSHLRLSYGAILPPVHLTKIPKFVSVDLRSLPPHLTPCDVPDSKSKAIFIYSPFQTGFQNTRVRWVCGCRSVVVVKVQNLLPVQLELKNLTVVGEGVAFEVSPASITLPIKSPIVSVELAVTPKEPGNLVLTGCSCEVLGIKSNCRFDDAPWLKRACRTVRVEVLPSLPVLEMGTSMRPAENQKPSELTETCTAEVTLYAGQKQTETIHLLNASEVNIDRLEWEIQQPTVFGVPPLISVPEDCEPLEFPFGPRSTRSIGVCITAVDPLAIEGESDEDTKQPESAQGAVNSIPYTGRILTATLKFSYCGKVDGYSSTDLPKTYQRSCALTILVTILPVVVVIDWHVLPGETSSSRYIALDVVNAADYEVDVQFPVEKTVTVQPKDLCRVPVLCECCDLTDVSSSYLIRGPRARHYLMEARRKFVREHVMARLKVTWALTSNEESCGSVPIGTILTSAKLCSELVMPRVMLEVIVSGAVGGTKDEYVTGVGERVTLTTNLVQTKNLGPAVAAIRLNYFQDYQNGLTACADEDVLQIGTTTHLVNLDERLVSYNGDFHFLFCNEGIYKVTVVCDITSKGERGKVEDDDMDDLIFGSPVMPVLSFNIVSRFDTNVP